MENQEKRTAGFQRNLYLEDYLKEINADLLHTEYHLLEHSYKKYPVIFVMGAMRSGSTLLMQWLANTGQFCYPSNIMSRFYGAPIIGAKIQRLLLDSKYNFRNEILDFSKEVNYSSQNGKTRGALAPNEFWYFWRRFFHYEDLEVDYMPDEELLKTVDIDFFVNELMGIANVFDKPIAMKGMIANYNINFLNQIFENVVFLHIKRNPVTNIASALEARKRQLGDIHEWYSFRIPEKEVLMKIKDPAIQVAGQIYCINKAVETALTNISDERKMEIQYEDFCESPETYYYLLRKKLAKQGFEISDSYHGMKKFDITRKETDPKLEQSYEMFIRQYF